MTRFEDRLSRHLAALTVMALAGPACNQDGHSDSADTATRRELAAMCDGAAGPKNYLVTEGFTTIRPGGECPTPDAARIDVPGCTFLEWQQITCGFVRVERDQRHVDDGYGGYWADDATAPTGTYPEVGPLVDVCFYDAVFYLPPDRSICGRPLLHEGAPVVAAVVPGASPWSEGDHPVTAGLPAADRSALAAYWLGCAALEHASVASFARFSLDLLRFGAPPALLRQAHQAGLDEIEHARLCFALASGYRGAPVGPGPLAADTPGAATLADLAEALVREGCVGETLAAIDAAARLVGARDPAVRAALTTILRDESAHAALAWRALRWALDQDHDGAIRARLTDVFTQEQARWTGPAAADAVSPDGRAHGLLAADARAHALRRGWHDVIAPSWAALSG